MLIFLASSLWQQHRANLIDDQQFALSLENIRVNQGPEWISNHLSSAMFQLAKSESSLLDPKIVPEAHDFVAKFPWVRNVNRVEKSVDGLDIDLEYREPIAFVDIGRKAIPIDVDGVVIDRGMLNQTQFRIMRENRLRISLNGLTDNSALPWRAWPDGRIPNATKLCQFIAPVSKRLELFRIVSFDLASSGNSPRLEIWTWNGTKVIWGSAPGMEIPGEAAAAMKLSAIEQFIKARGPLTEFPNPETLDIDVKSGKAILVKPSRLAELEDFRERILK
jgi:hypothetical protein